MYLYISLSITTFELHVYVYILSCNVNEFSYRQQKENKADVLHFTNKEAVIYDDVCMTTTGKAFYNCKY